MKEQFDNKLLSSFLLLLDHQIQDKGEAFTNFNSRFYPIKSNRTNQYVYAAPFKQLCNDTSISGANIISGVYLNGNYVTIGQSGLAAINHYDGAVFFTNPLPTNTIISGNYAIKDFSIVLTDQPEYKLLFETVYSKNNTYIQNFSGIQLDTKTFPIIFLKTKSDENEPFALGGIENKTKIIRAIVIADNEYQKIAVSNILKDMSYSPFYLKSGIPFDALGNFTGNLYNFNNLSNDYSFFPWIMKVKISDVPSIGDYKSINQNIAMVDFTINTIAQHRY